MLKLSFQKVLLERCNTFSGRGCGGLRFYSPGTQQKSKVFSFGSGANGKLGHGKLENKIIQPKELEPSKFGDTRITDITSGTTYSLFAGLSEGTKKVAFFGCGDNRDAQLMVGKGKVTVLEEIEQLPSPSIDELPAGRSIRQLTSGTYHNICLLDDYTSLLWGSSNSGQLGSPEYLRVQYDPYNSTLLKSLQIEKYACGTTFTLALDSKGAVHSCGSATYNELGHGEMFTERTPRVIDHEALRIGAKDIAAGFYHSLVLLSDNRIAGWGRNQEGQCQPVAEGIGRGSFTGVDLIDPEGVAEIHARGEQIVQISCSSLNSYFLTSGGTVYSMGSNEHGQLGVGKLTKHRVGRLNKVNLPVKVSKMYSGFKSVIVMDEEGKRFFGWGSNFDHQLSIEKRSICFDPIELTNLNNLIVNNQGFEVRQISLSLSHSTLLMSNKE